MSLLVAVTTCHRYDYRDKGNKEHQNGSSRKRVQAVRETWAKKNCGLDIRYFYGRTPEPREPLSDEVFLDVSDEYYGLSEKTRGIFRWALANGYDALLKVDDDTFVNLPAFLRSGFEQHEYTGHVVLQQETPYVCGFTYFLNKRPLEILAEHELDWTNFEGRGFDHSDLKWAEDKLVGLNLNLAGILPHHDPRYQACVCDVCWHGYTDQISVNTTPRNELMYTLCPNIL